LRGENGERIALRRLKKAISERCWGLPSVSGEGANWQGGAVKGVRGRVNTS